MTTVVYIAGKGRSGSTLLDRLAGQIDGVFSAGELWRLWHEDTASYLCGCGLALDKCPVWSQVLASSHARGVDAAEVRTLQQKLFSWRVAPRVVVTGSRAADWEPMRRYVFVMQNLYHDIAAVTDSQAVVDSSKWPFDPIVVSQKHDLDVRLVHLVRDVRAVAHSWRRVKYYEDRPETEAMPRFGTVHSVASWTVRNLATEWAAKRSNSLRMRYEDLAASPDTEMARLADFVGCTTAGLSIAAGSAELGVTHTVAGNPGRMEHGSVEIRSDDAWTGEMPARQRRLATYLSWPLLRRYEYL